MYVNSIGSILYDVALITLTIHSDVLTHTGIILHLDGIIRTTHQVDPTSNIVKTAIIH